MRKIVLIAITFFIPFFGNASVFINEVAWMGTAVSANDEWIELRNDGPADVDLSDWTLTAVGGTPNVNFSNAINKTIPAGGFYLMERTDDTTVPSVAADLIYTGALSNSGEILILKDKTGAEIDRVGAQDKWPAGDNVTKQTMQRLAAGNWITAIATPKANNASSGQSSQSSSSSQNSSASSQASASSNTSGILDWSTEPQIFANAGADKTAVAGADVLFEGKALGLKKEPLENARYLWTFGDGASAEGKNVRHFYKYPGEYIAVLNISSGQYPASDRINVKVVPNELRIVDANNEFIKLKNKSNIILDVSGWFLTGGGFVFKFPESSLIAANAEPVISSDISKIKFSENSTVNLLYPNGSIAFEYKKEIKAATSVSSVSVTNASKIVAIKTISAKSSSSSLGNLPSVSSTFQSNNQVASVVYTADSIKAGWKIWLYLALGLGILGGGGLFFIRRDGGV